MLGPVRVEDGCGAAIELSSRPRAILAVLAARPGQEVSIDRLIETVWGETPPPAARASLQVHVSNLRDALEPERETRSPGRYLATGDGSYVLNIAPGELDSLQFEGLVTSGRTAAANGSFRAAAAQLAEGLALWRGDAFEDVGDMVAEQARWLDALRLDVEEDHMAAELAAGNHRAVVADLERLVERQPLRERRVQLLMLALYRCGRQKDALARYRVTRVHLVEELGIEPGAELQELDRAILQQSPGLHLPAAAPASWVPPPRKGIRPVVRPELVDRDDDVKRVLSALDRSRLVGITGPAGVGKSALVRRLAHDIDDDAGAWYVDLTTVTNGEHVRSAIGDGVGAPGARTSALVETVGGGILVLDDHDHVSDAVAAVVTEVLARAPELRIVTTGREALGLPDERVVTLAPLSTEPPQEGGLAPATRLLVDRSGVDDWRPDQVASLAELAAQLDGLPLALELAAARLGALEPAAIVERLERGGALLRRTRAVSPPHHRSLEEAVAWSHGLLSENARRVLDVCSIFAAPFSLDAAEHVCADTVARDDVAPALAELVERSFLSVEGDGRRVYRMYMPVRSLGQERLRAAGHEDAVRARHGVYLATFMARSAAALGKGSLTDTRRTLDRSLPDLRKALDWLEHQPDVDLHFRAVGPLAAYWFASARLSEGRGRYEAATERTGASTGATLDVLTGAAFLAWFQADYAAAARYHEQCLELGEAGLRHAGALAIQGSLAWIHGDLEESARCHGAAVELERPRGDSFPLASALIRAANTAWFAGRYEDAAAQYREAAEITARIGNDLLRGVALRGESYNLALGGRAAEAQALAAESLELGDRLGDRLNRGQSHAFVALVDLACDAVVHEHTEAHLVAAASLAGEIVDVFCLALAIAGLGELARRTAEWERCVTLWAWLGHLRDATGLPLPPAERDRQAQGLDEAARALSSAVFERAARTGRELALPALVALATRRA